MNSDYPVPKRPKTPWVMAVDGPEDDLLARKGATFSPLPLEVRAPFWFAVERGVLAKDETRINAWVQIILTMAPRVTVHTTN